MRKTIGPLWIRGCLVAMIAAAMPLRMFSATIAWEDAQNVGADSDVSTEGELLYAYNENNVDAEINGVLFRGLTTADKWYVNSYDPDVQLASFSEARNATRTDFCPNFAASATCSSAYKNLLAGTAFHRNAGTSTVTLLGLQPGEEYLVQIWLNDSRQAGYQEVLDGTCTVSTHPDGASYGQYAIGRFRADSTEQTISLYSATSAIINAIQVRKLPSIAWGEARTIGDGSEVVNAGTSLYAYHVNNGKDNLYVNGVAFKNLNISGDNVLLASPTELIKTGSGTSMITKSEYPAGTPEDYPNVVYSLLYVKNNWGATWLDATLTKLVPGRKYLVQIWYVDARYDVSECTLYQKVDGVRVLNAYDGANGYRGQTVSGVFVAASTNKTIRMRGYREQGQKNNPAFNALQVRDITDVAVESLVVENATVGLADETSVRNEGLTVYAYTPSSSDLTVNGVTFAWQTSTASWGDGNVQLSGFTQRRTDAFHTETTTPFDKLLAAGVFAGGGQLIMGKSLTFNGLEPFKPHLVQVFVHDSRAGTQDRRVKFGSQTEFVPYTNSAVVVFLPCSSSLAMNMQYTANSAQSVSPQVNAVQVRRLNRLPTPAGGDLLVWAGGAAGAWTTGSSGWTSSGTLPANPWSAEEGAGKDALVDAEGETTLTVGVGVTVRNLVSTGALTLNGMPAVTGEIMGGNVTIASAWPEATLAKTKGGRLTLAGDRTALRQLVVSDGVLSLAANQQCSTIRRCVIGYPGAIELPEGVVQPVETVEGNGSVEGAGTFVVDCVGAKTVGGVWTGTTTLRKTGAEALTVEAVSSGTPVLDIQSGVATLASESESPWALDVAAGATVDLGGKAHPISGIYGAGTIRNGTIAGTATNAGPVTVESSVSFAEGFALVRGDGEPMVIDRETFDLSSISSVGFVDPAAFFAAQKHVLRTTGTFTGTPPRLTCRGYTLEIIPLDGGGQALILHQRGVILLIH
ncbi:MAG: hypothetical protein IKE55_09745 [Kiritimatiellae bacterium]|nr:hypothetical protein [Kiritimatiellia bacterium]